MDTPTARRLTVEAVLFGFLGPAVKRPTPFGFVIRVASSVVVHRRGDLDALNLPDLFAFTARHMPARIARACSEAGDAGALHDVLADKCFSGFGSFRCWAPIRQEVGVEEIDAFVEALRAMVDREIARYRSDAGGDAAHTWLRTPGLQEVPTMPSVHEAVCA